MKPGTVIDKGITDIYRYDFYLQACSFRYPCPSSAKKVSSQAHKALQGTGRSTHYTVIYDENQLPVDTLQQGTHTASYTYARATKAVRWVILLIPNDDPSLTTLRLA